MRDARVVADLLELLVAERDRELLDAERVGAGLVEDRVLHRGVQALDQRHHGDDRRHRDDVAEHGHQRSQLRRPRSPASAMPADSRILFMIGSGGAGGRSLTLPACCRRVSIVHRDRRRRMPRTELYGPVTTSSPGFRPVEHLEVLVAGDAQLDRHELDLAVRGRRRRLRSPCASVRASAPRPTATGSIARRPAPAVGRAAFTTWPLAS